jgi:hypothetical protein
MKTATKQITKNDLRKMTQDEYWGGYGYIGEKQGILSSLVEMHFTKENQERQIKETMHYMDTVDSSIVEYANENGWTYEKLFAWVNSKMGRHFANEMFMGDDNLIYADRWITARNRYLKNYVAGE